MSQDSFRRSHRLAWAVTLTLFLFVASCDGDKNARAIWTDALQKCAASDLIGPNVLFFGPSNALGPGTIFQKFPDGAMQPSHLLSEYETNPSSLMAPSNPTGCVADTSSTFQFGANVDVGQTLPVTASVGIELKKAKTVALKVQAWAWDQLVTSPYRQKILGLPDKDPVKDDLLRAGHLVLSRAIKVQGMEANLEFSSKVAPSVKASVPGGSIGGGLTATWTSDTKLTIKSDSSFFLAGELRQFSEEGGMALAAPREIGPLVTNVSHTAVRSRTK